MYYSGFRSRKYFSLSTLDFFVTVAFLNISPDSVHFLARDDQPNPQNNQKEELKEGRISKFESFGLGEYES